MPQASKQNLICRTFLCTVHVCTLDHWNELVSKWLLMQNSSVDINRRGADVADGTPGKVKASGSILGGTIECT